jgi:hypothetical protein
VSGFGKSPKISKKQAALFSFAILLILIAGLKPIGFDRDSQNYVQILDGPVRGFFSNYREPLYLLIIELNRILFSSSPTGFFLIFAILGVSLKIHAIGQLSLAPIVSIFVYIPLYFILHEMTQIRAGVASALFLLSLIDLRAGNKLLFVLKIALGTMFHFSAIIGLVIIRLNTTKIYKPLYLALPIVGLALSVLLPVISLLEYLIAFAPVFVSSKLNLYLTLLSEGKHSRINVFNFYFISVAVIYYFAIIHSDFFKSKYDILLVKITGIMLFSFYGLSSIPVLSFRISEYFGVVLIILLANMMKMFRQKLEYFLILQLWLIIYLFGLMLPQNLNFGVF